MSLTATILLGREIPLPQGTVHCHRISDDDRGPGISHALPVKPVKLVKIHNSALEGLMNRAAVADALRDGPLGITDITFRANVSTSTARRWLLDMMQLDEVVRYSVDGKGKKFLYRLTEDA